MGWSQGLRHHQSPHILVYFTMSVHLSPTWTLSVLLSCVQAMFIIAYGSDFHVLFALWVTFFVLLFIEGYYILANCTFRLLHKSHYPSYHNPIVILKIARHLFLQSCSISCARHRLLDLILFVSNVGFPISPLPPGKGWISRSYTQHTCPYCSFQPTRSAHHPIFL